MRNVKYVYRLAIVLSTLAVLGLNGCGNHDSATSESITGSTSTETSVSEPTVTETPTIEPTITPTPETPTIEPTMTPTPETPTSEPSGKEVDYTVYIPLLETAYEASLEYKNSSLWNPGIYYLIDIDSNSVDEILIRRGMNDNEYYYDVSSINDSGEVISLGEIGGWRTSFARCESDGNVYIFVENYAGLGDKTLLTLSDQTLHFEKIYEDQDLWEMEGDTVNNFFESYSVDDHRPLQ